MIYVTMVYGPIAAWLVELFPALIRYTTMSLPYHIGNGWFGGFLMTVVIAFISAGNQGPACAVIKKRRGAVSRRAWC
jgi:hypothetical protein